MRWNRARVLKAIGLTMIGIAPFVVAFLLLPDGEKTPSPSPTTSATSPAGPLAFPFTPSPSPPPRQVVQVTPSPTITPNTPTVTQCSNRKDDDKDGKIDTADPGCSSRNDNSEAPDPGSSPAPGPSAPPLPPSPEPPPVSDCSDGVDNDGDGLIDGADPGCGDGTEAPFNNTDPGNECELPGVPGCPSGPSRQRNPAADGPEGTITTEPG